MCQSKERDVSIHLNLGSGFKSLNLALSFKNLIANYFPDPAGTGSYTFLRGCTLDDQQGPQLLKYFFLEKLC